MMHYRQVITETYEPHTCDSRKSFYGKCKIINTEGGYSYLQSYDTIVAYRKNGVVYRTWGGWSATTGRHLQVFGIMGKKEWEKLPVISLPIDSPFSR